MGKLLFHEWGRLLALVSGTCEVHSGFLLLRLVNVNLLNRDGLGFVLGNILPQILLGHDVSAGAV
jgi:hypothetical protein